MLEYLIQMADVYSICCLTLAYSWSFGYQWWIGDWVDKMNTLYTYFYILLSYFIFFDLFLEAPSQFSLEKYLNIKHLFFQNIKRFNWALFTI